MYELEHPAKIFEKYISDIKVPLNKSKVYVVMLDSELRNIISDMDTEWQSLSDELDQFKAIGNLIEKKINIPDPNNPDSTLPATIFIAYTD